MNLSGFHRLQKKVTHSYAFKWYRYVFANLVKGERVCGEGGKQGKAHNMNDKDTGNLEVNFKWMREQPKQ